MVMDKQTLGLIQQLMEKLADEMEYGEDELCDRLGKKPKMKEVPVDVKVLKVESPEEHMEEEPMDDMEEESPEEVLKKRLMKLRS